MNNKLQREFMYLFERVGEPVYFGPKGTGRNMTYYSVSLDGLSPQERDSATTIQTRLGGMSSNTLQVARPDQVPDVSSIGQLCPKNSLFSYYVPGHQRALSRLKQIFNSAPNVDEFMRRCVYCRDNPMINSTLWTNAVASACLQRTDMRGFRLPAFFEIMPDMFVGPSVMRQCQRQATLPSRDRSVIEIMENTLTGANNNPENILAYWREDIGMNSHHWHWHLVFPGDLGDPPRNVDRRGEMFYYMHHSMMARYEAERLSNGMPRVKPLNLERPIIEEGYFSKLTATNAGQNWGTRQEVTEMKDVFRLDDPAINMNITMADLKKFRDRILAAIDTGRIIDAKNGNRMVDLTWETGTDILGDIIENSVTLSRNLQYYGSFGFHNMGHVIIASCHDPKWKHRENFGPMGDTPTAMRDPVFYRWHSYIDNIFDEWKVNPNIHTPYQPTGGQLPLVWNGIVVNDVNVQIQGRNPNILVTSRMQSDVDLSRGIDFGRRDENNLGPVWVRYTHLNYEPFSYQIRVTNNTGQATRGTVRIYLAPRESEEGTRIPLRTQRRLFFEMDKFAVDLPPGEQPVTRSSLESSVTIPWNQTFRDLERSVEMPTPDLSVCGCGWPQHMLLPKGKSQGMAFDLFVMVTNAAEDTPRNMRQTTPRCQESISFCGILDETFPDTKPMGYPFDRQVRNPNIMIENFMPSNTNGMTKQVTIVHSNMITVREGGAPSGATIIPMNPDNPMQPQPQPQQTRPVGNNTRPNPPPIANPIRPIQGSPVQNRPNNQVRPTNQGGNTRPGFNNGQINFNGHRPQQQVYNNFNRPQQFQPVNNFGGGWRRHGRSPSPTDWTFEGDDIDENDPDVQEYWHD